ncbi:MAG: hypothetical protein RL318_42 [Fibrobacterota bacterium]|jgi:hypothetical protein
MRLLTGLFLGLGAFSTAQAATMIVAANGSDAAAGTVAAPLSLGAALKKVAAGDTILMRGGVYAFSAQITIDSLNAGAPGKRKCLFAYAGERPVLDFSSQPYGKTSDVSNPRGLQVDGNYWHIKGLEVMGSADNGIYVSGNDNIVESCWLHRNRDTGLQLGRRNSTLAEIALWPSRNLILNCEAWDNFDTLPNAGENADGFAVKLTTGVGNVFRGCIAHHNIDDGWDLFTKVETGAIGPVTIDQCVAHHNGTLTTGFVNPKGDKNGFKLGGTDIANQHFVSRSVAYGNGKNGFTWNSNPGAIQMVNNLAFDNSLSDGNYKFGQSSAPSAAVFYNNVSAWSAGVGYTDKRDGVTDVDSSNCLWDKSKTPKSRCGRGRLVDMTDFVSNLAQYSEGLLKPRRLADSTVDLSVFGLSMTSELANAGTVPPDAAHPGIAITYVGLPDLGAYERPGVVGLRPAGTLSRLNLRMDGRTLQAQLPRAGLLELEILDAQGRVVATPAQEWGADRVSFALPPLRSGMWLVRGRFNGESFAKALAVP